MFVNYCLFDDSALTAIKPRSSATNGTTRVTCFMAVKSKHRMNKKAEVLTDK